MTSATRPVLVEVTRHPEHYTFTARDTSGHLIPHHITRPAWVRPGQSLEDSTAPLTLEVWSSDPRQPTPHPPLLLAVFSVEPETTEGAAALAALRCPPNLEGPTKPPHPQA